MTSQPRAELWDVDQLAGYLSVGRRFVYRITHQKRIRYMKIGNELRFDPAEIATFLERQTTPNQGEAPRRRGRPRNTARGRAR